jgi:quinol monooxygenase YgiN
VAIAISSRWQVTDGEQEAVAAAVAALIPQTRAEPGLVLLHAHRDPEDSRVFYFYEQYVDEEALAAHAETRHFKRYARDICLPRLEGRERHTYVTWEPS